MTEPTQADLLSAFKLCKARNWPDNFDEAMADPARARLVRMCAKGRLRRMQPRSKSVETEPLPQAQLLPSWPPRKATGPPQIDRKRAAAGDIDD